MAGDLIVLTDVGSTTTKAVLLAPAGGGGRYRLAARADASTTVEAPDEDVAIGVRRALAELSRRSGESLLAADGFGAGAGSRQEAGARVGLNRSRVGRYLSTSSAGGGLQVMVCGVMRRLTASSAEQAALGAGAIVLDVLAVDDDRTPLKRFQAIANARPDMVLVAGGMEGGTPKFILETCDFLNLAEMRPRFGRGYRLPIVFAGAETVREMVEEMLNRRYSVLMVPNLRPDVSRENLEPVRQAVVELFESHVMAQAPGYEQLLRLVDGPVLPTPVAVGKILSRLSAREHSNILCMDLGGATTDVFSFVDGRFTRSVSANLGVSYSATNVLAQASAAKLAGWLPFAIGEDELRDQVGNKTLHPTTIPETVRELFLEQALATEAIRLATEQHLAVFRPETGPQEVVFGRRQAEFIGKIKPKEATLPDLDPGLIIGSGGLLASAPLRAQAAMVMINSLRPGGVRRLYVDSVFMLPHLGVLSEHDPETAMDVLLSDCLIPLGTVAGSKPSGVRRGLRGRGTAGGGAVGARLAVEGDRTREVSVAQDEIGVIPLPAGVSGDLSVSPLGGQDYGAGPGAQVSTRVMGGAVGIIIDNRTDPAWTGEWPGPERTARVLRWMATLGALPDGWRPPGAAGAEAGGR